MNRDNSYSMKNGILRSLYFCSAEKLCRWKHKALQWNNFDFIMWNNLSCLNRIQIIWQLCWLWVGHINWILISRFIVIKNLIIIRLIIIKFMVGPTCIQTDVNGYMYKYKEIFTKLNCHICIIIICDKVCLKYTITKTIIVIILDKHTCKSPTEDNYIT